MSPNSGPVSWTLLHSVVSPFIIEPVGWEGIVAPAMQEQRPGREGRAKKRSLPMGMQFPQRSLVAGTLKFDNRHGQVVPSDYVDT